MKRLTFFHPELSQTWYEIGTICSIIGHYDTALQAFKNAFHTNSVCFDAIYGIGQVAVAVNDIDLLRDSLEKLKAEPNERFRFLVLSAHFLLRINDIEKSFECFKNAGSYLNKDPFFLYGLGLFLETIKCEALAGKVFLRHYNQCSLVGENSKLLYRIGVIYKNSGQGGIALRIFNVLTLMPENNLPLKSLALQIAHIRITNKEYEIASEIISEVIQWDKTNVFSYYLAAWMIFLGAKSEYNAECVYQWALEYDDAFLYYMAGRLLSMKNDAEKAFIMYKKAIVKDKDDPWFWNSIGILYVKNKQYKEASDKFTIACRLENFFFEAKNNMKKVEELLKNKELNRGQIVEDLDISNDTINHIAYDSSELMKKSQEYPLIDQFLDIKPDLRHSSYFSAAATLGEPIKKFDRNKRPYYVASLKIFFDFGDGKK